MNFANPVRAAVFKKFNQRIHFEKVKRTPDTAADYCMKEDTRLEGPFTFGERPVQRNSKTDWKGILENAKSGKLDDIPCDIIVKHYGNLKKIEKDHMVVGDAPGLRGVWIHGPTGVGKSRYARQNFPNHYPKLCNKWWDGY